MKIVIKYMIINLKNCNYITQQQESKMSDNFKYDNYDEDFQLNNPSNMTEKPRTQPKQPQTIKLLGKQQKRENDVKVQVKTVSNANTGMQNSTKGKLIDQHVKLKSQLKQLASKMDEILQKQRERKKKKLHGNADEEDERIVQMKKKLKDEEQRMLKIKAQVNRLRKNMDHKYDMNKIVDKENELKHLRKQLQVLEQQKQSLQKIRKTQDKAIRNQDDKQSKNKKSRMEDQLREIQTQTKKQYEIINQKQKQVRKLHETYIMKLQKVKDIESKLNQKKKSQQDQITPDAIAKLQQELKQIEDQKAIIQKEGNQKLKALERERKELKHEQQRKKLIFEQKQKQLRLNQMKHKQIIRLINSNQQQVQINESRVEKQNKNEGKRVVAKKGREVPNLQVQGQQQVIEQKNKQQIVIQEKKPQVKPKPEKHQYGFSANLDEEEGIIDDA